MIRLSTIVSSRLALVLVLALSLTFSLSLSAQSPIEIRWNGSDASVNIPAGITDVEAFIEGANVDIRSTNTTTEYTYRLSGSSTDGSLVIRGDYKLTIQLAGLQLTNSHGGAAIDVECGKRIAVELVSGTVNTLADKSGNQKAALYFSGHPEFEGGGTLNVTGQVKHAICAKEYLTLKASTGIINIRGAVSDGIHCGKGKVNNENNYFLMRGGNVNIMNVGGDGVDSDDYGTITIEGGGISINVGDGATGLKADSTVTISGGMVSMAVNGTDSEGIRTRYNTTISGGRTDIVVNGNGSKGIKGKRYTEEETVLNGGFVTISGGQVNIQVHGGDLPDATTGDISKCMAISVDADYRQTSGNVTITALGLETHTLNVNGTESRTGGTLDIVHTPWSLKPGEYQYDMSACIKVSRNGNVITDYSGIAVGAFIGTRFAGFARFPEGADYGLMRIYGTTADEGSIVKFRLYDYTNDSEYALTSSSTKFAPQSALSTPDNPKYLTCPKFQLGDTDNNGKIDNADIENMTLCILGRNSSITRGDMDGDGETTIADIARAIQWVIRNQNP